MTEVQLAAGAHDPLATTAEPEALTAAPGLSDAGILSIARSLRKMTMQAIASNGAARLALSEEFLNIDYLIDREDIFLGLQGEFQSLAQVEHPGNLFVDANGRRFILINPFSTIQDRQFFLAAQVGHFKLHVPQTLSKKRTLQMGVYFPRNLIDPLCFRQASIFAYGLLVPKELELALVAHCKDHARIVDDRLMQDAVDKTLMPSHILKRHISLVSKTAHPAGQIAG